MPDVPERYTFEADDPPLEIGLGGTIQQLTDVRTKVKPRRFVTGFCAPNTPLPEAEFKPRQRRACAGCGKRRLTLATVSGPKCNDCLAGGR